MKRDQGAIKTRAFMQQGRRGDIGRVHRWSRGIKDFRLFACADISDEFYGHFYTTTVCRWLLFSSL